MPGISIVSSRDKIDSQKWDRFIDECDQALIFHTRSFCDFIDRQPHSKTQYTFALQGEDIVGVFLKICYRSKSALFDPVTSRAISMGGPVVQYNQTSFLIPLLTEGDNYGSVYSEIRCFTDNSWADEFLKKTGFKYKPHLNVLVKIQGEDLMWSALKSSKRNKIRKSEKLGLEVEICNEISLESLKSCYSILKELYHRIQLPLPAFDFFLSLIKSDLARHVVFVLARFQENIVGFRLQLVFKERVFDWYAADSPEFRHLHINDRCVWESLKWSEAQGMKIFDFGGAGSPDEDYGVRDFKVQFGGELVEFGRYVNIHKPFVMSVAKMGLRIAQKIGIMKVVS